MPSLLAALVGLLLGAGLGARLARRTVRPGPPPPEPPPAAPEQLTPPEDIDQTKRLADAGSRLSAVAHELASPLTAILAFAEDLLRAEPSIEQREALLVIRHQAKRSRRLLEGLLESVRGTTRVPPPQLVDPAALVDRVAQVYERECASRGLAFAWELGHDLPRVRGREGELEQVLTNLLQNACQATPRGGRVTLVAQVRGRLLEFVVRDSGPGIPPEILPRVFEPFYTTKPEGEGTGLGLAIAQDIVRRHRGILTAENISALEGGGARFVVAVPFEDRRWRDRDPEPEDQQLAAAPPAPPDARRILLVEDQRTLRFAVRRYLQRLGWAVDEAEDGRAALAALLPESGPCPYAAVICDVRLPGITGLTVYERIAAEAPELRDRLILVTGDADAPDVAAFRARTGAEVLQKPYELGILAGLLDRITGGPGMGRTA